MRRVALVIAAFAVLGFAIAFLLSPTPESDDNLVLGVSDVFAEINEARADCEKETEGWRYRECLERNSAATAIILGRGNLGQSHSGPSQSLIERADAGDPEASLEYGYHLVAKAAVEDTVPENAIPYLMTAALAGDTGAHVQLALIEVVTKEKGDLIRAWAHLDIALREMPTTAPDYRRSEMHFNDIDTGMSSSDRGTAKKLADQYRETMRANRNTLK